MQRSAPSKTVEICFKPAFVQVLAQLGTKTGLARNNVIRHAIARLAEREGIRMPTNPRRAALRKVSGSMKGLLG